MATNTIILRPSTLYYDMNNGSGGPGDENSYQVTAVNEAVADDDGSYVSALMTTGTSGTHSLYYGVETPTDIPKAIIGGRLYIRYWAAADACKTQMCFSLGGSNKDSSYDEIYSYAGVSEWTTHSRDLPSAFVAKVNESLANGVFPTNICIYVTLTAGKGTPKVTQIYLELDYEGGDIGIHKKVNGTWKAATAAYKKVSGAWTEISADECKAYLASSFVTK